MATPAKKTTSAPAKKAEPPKKEPHFPSKEWVEELKAEDKAEAKKAAPAAKASPAKVPETKPPPPVTKAAPAKAEPEAKKAEPAKKSESKKDEDRPEPVFTGLPAPESEQQPTDKLNDRETLEATAADRGWVHGATTDDFDAVYTKSNPVLGGYEHLRVNFKGDKLGDVEHENLNQAQDVPDKDKLDYALSVLTGEWAPTL